MTVKNGFLLIEVMLGLSLTVLLFSIIAFYTTIINKVQREACMRLQLVSVARNAIEKMIAHKGAHGTILCHNNDYKITVTAEKIDDNEVSGIAYTIQKITIQDNHHNDKKSVDLVYYGDDVC